MCKAQLPVGHATHGQVVLDGGRELAEQVTENKPVSSTRPWPLLHLLPPCVYLSIREQAYTVMVVAS